MKPKNTLTERVLALLLALVTATALVPAPALAEEVDELAATPQAEAAAEEQPAEDAAPAALASRYDREGADEVVFLDITATSDDRRTTIELASRAACELRIHYTVGGGLRDVAGCRAPLAAGYTRSEILQARSARLGAGRTKELHMADVRPSIPRTPAQVTLRVVSAIMALLGGLVVVGAALVFLNRDQLGLAEESMWTVLTYGGIILAAAGLLLLTAWLGFRAADDSSRVGPYRFLCYFVGLVVLVAIVWGWGMGMFLLFNPVVLASTVTYVLVCSQLADKVAEEHEAGVKGEVFLRTGRQRTLHLLAEVVLVKGAILGVVVAVMAVTVFAVTGSSAGADLARDLGLEGTDLVTGVVVGLVTAAANVLVGCLGIWGSNRPQKIVPFFVMVTASFAFDVAKTVVSVAVAGGLSSVGMDVLLDLLFTGSCAWLSWKIWRQPRELVDKRLIVEQ